ncbi:hypothetical protein Scel_48230 [Streptomyces cellostaticus]|nr:hypothetical protein Scel_48230 [Streptomyces cellostaticus]
MPGRGQHDTDRGEHRGPQDPEPGSGARRARVGGSHGGLIIALALPEPYGRSRDFVTAGDRHYGLEDHLPPDFMPSYTDSSRGASPEWAESRQ